jgi:hypothetical protein
MVENLNDIDSRLQTMFTPGVVELGADLHAMGAGYRLAGRLADSRGRAWPLPFGWLAMQAASMHSVGQIVSRIAAAVLGGYAFVWGVTTLGISIGLAMGSTYGDAQTAMHLFAFLVFLVAFIWSFSSARLWRIWTVLAGGGALMTGAAWLITTGLR